MFRGRKILLESRTEIAVGGILRIHIILDDWEAFNGLLPTLFSNLNFFRRLGKLLFLLHDVDFSSIQ